MKKIELAHGNGGVLSSNLIRESILKKLGRDRRMELGDAAEIFDGEYGMTTDSFVIYPRTFPGGDIGKLSICGTINDLIMGGYKPEYISLALIIEEGFSIIELESIILSIKKECEKCDVQVVTGDTKVVEKGFAGGGMFINTTGIGKWIRGTEISSDKIQEGDKIIVTGNVGDHGVAILCEREGMFRGQLESDCNSLIELIPLINKYSENIKFLRDPTRGGVGTTLNEMIEGKDVSVQLQEEEIPYNNKILGACEILGLDPLYSANEGKAIIVIEKNSGEDFLRELKGIETFENAAFIGEIVKEEGLRGKVVMTTGVGGRRILKKLIKDIMPRIC